MSQLKSQWWQSMRDMQPAEPLTVVVVEYRADGRTIEHVRVSLPPRSSDIQFIARHFTLPRRSTR